MNFKVTPLKWSQLDSTQKQTILQRPVQHTELALKQKVSAIIQQVRSEGDSAIKLFTAQFDRLEIDSLAVSEAEKNFAFKQVSPDLKNALQIAIDNISKFHQAQKPVPVSVETMPGVRCWREWRAVERVGLYIPAGLAPLPSTVLMLGVPAALAQCPTQILCSPALRSGPHKGQMDPHIIVAAHMVGIKQLFKVGGAQAIAAMAYGTQSIPKVDKIFGPGNTWVTEAKLQVAQDPAGAMYDLPAGPSELLVLADDSANAELIAADLLSQAEHGADSQVILVGTEVGLMERVEAELNQQLTQLSRAEIARQSLQHARFILVNNVEQGLDVSNLYAPEHLIINCQNAEQVLAQVQNAGSVFVGAWSPESVGDYASGTNHVLPTYGYARTCGGVSLESFLKPITFQQLSPKGIQQLGSVVEQLATVEGLDAHAMAVTRRLKILQAQAKG